MTRITVPESRESLLDKIGISLADGLIEVFVSRIQDRERNFKPYIVDKICVYGENIKLDDIFYVVGKMNDRIEEVSSRADSGRQSEAARDLLMTSIFVGYGSGKMHRGVYDVNLSDSQLHFFDECGELIQRGL